MIRLPSISTLFPYTTLFRSILPRARRQVVPCRRQRGYVRVLGPSAGRQRPAARAWSSRWAEDRKSTRLNSSHLGISYAVFCLKKKINYHDNINDLKITVH